MRRYRFNPKTQNGWKSYPVRVLGPNFSECHKRPTILVQSMQGGYVTANCADCGRKDTLSPKEFRGLALWVSCPECRKQMRPDYLPAPDDKNYGYVCADCGVYVWLADLLPHWVDI